MPFDFQQFTIDYRIPTAPKGHKHNRQGWINIQCPLHSGSQGGYHLGFNIVKSYFYCYGCGSHKIEEVIEAIIGKAKVLSVIKQYTAASTDQPELAPIIRPISITLPQPIGPLIKLHKDYLINRNFDPDMLAYRWQLKGTEHYSILNIGGDKIDYHHRIIAPVDYHHQTISFQGRDITNLQSAKYKACPDAGEVIPHKQMLYGWDMIQGDSCIVVEGITGVWRLGPGALATFGAEYTAGQLELLSRFQTIHLFFDADEAGQIAADNMQWELFAIGKDVIVWDFSKNAGLDSGNIAQKNADEIMKEVLG